MANTKKHVGIVFAACATTLCVTFGVYYFKSYKKIPSGPRVDKSITEILAERSAQAKKQMESPLGQAVTTKNWVQFDQIYQPNTQYQQLAEAVRGMYIQNAFSSFTVTDYDELILRFLSTLKTIDSKQYPKLGLFMSQFQRLPAPTKNSVAYKTLKDWLKSENHFLKKLAVFKLVGSDADPEDSAVKAYLHGFTGDTLGATKVEWLRFTDEIRNIKVKHACVAELSRLYPKMDSKLRPYVLPMLAREPSVETSRLVKYTLHALAQNDSAYIEAALKSIPPLAYNKILTPEQKEKILLNIKQIPESATTPYIRSKGNEVAKLLSSKP